jgi:uncharacterized protein YbjT (DUF2867 family)
VRILIIGGTGLISQGIVKHLLLRGDDISVFNRGQREDSLPTGLKRFVGDRNQADQLGQAVSGGSFDVVIDMVCFNPEQAEGAVKTFAGVHVWREGSARCLCRRDFSAGADQLLWEE